MRTVIISGIIFLVLSTSVGFSQHLDYAGSTLWSDLARTKVVGNYAYCALGAGLEILDISNPQNSIKISQLYLNSYETEAVDVSGNYAYVGGFDTGLNIVDISNPANPVLTGQLDIGDSPIDITVRDDLAYIATAYTFSSLVIVDISNPSDPRILSSYQVGGDNRGLDVSGNYAFLANESQGLIIFDIGDPINPMNISNINPIHGNAFGVHVVGNSAFLADGDQGLKIIDLTNPTIPQIIGSCVLPGQALAARISGNYCFIADGLSGLQVINISDLSRPTISGHFSTPFDADFITLVNNIAYVSDYSSLQILNISNPAGPTLVGSYDTDMSPASFAVSGNYALVTGKNFLWSIDASDETNPVVADKYIAPLNLGDIKISGNYAYVIAGNDSLLVIDISNPHWLQVVSTIILSQMLCNIYISGEYAFIGYGDYYGDGGALVLNISDPFRPLQIASVSGPTPTRILVSGGYLYYIDDGIRIFNISDITNPQEIGWHEINCWGRPIDAEIRDNYLYIALGMSTNESYGYLRIFDISNPVNPVQRGGLDFSDEAQGISIQGNTAFVGIQFAGVAVIDITDPSVPYLIEIYQPHECARQLKAVDNLLFINNEWSFQIARINSGCHYVSGDINNNGTSNGVDIVYAINYFKGGPPPPSACDCPGHGMLYAAGDVNGNCAFNGIDITFFVRILKGQVPSLLYCPDCPPVSKR